MRGQGGGGIDGSDCHSSSGIVLGGGVRRRGRGGHVSGRILSPGEFLICYIVSVEWFEIEASLEIFAFWTRLFFKIENLEARSAIFASMAK